MEPRCRTSVNGARDSCMLGIGTSVAYLSTGESGFTNVTGCVILRGTHRSVRSEPLIRPRSAAVWRSTGDKVEEAG